MSTASDEARSHAPHTKKKRTYPSRAETFFVADDRWGKRWVFTPYYMLRLDVSRRTGRLPKEPGIWQNGQPCTDWRWTGKEPPQPHRVIRRSARPHDELVTLARLERDGEPLIVSDPTWAEGRLEVWQRADRGFTFLDQRFVKKVLDRLPTDVVAVQAPPAPSSYGDGVPRAVLFVHDRQVVGVVMPIADHSRRLVGQVSEAITKEVRRAA